MGRHFFYTFVFAALAAAGSASAQTAAPSQAPAAAGWTFTPSFLAGTSWDDNALIRSSGPDAPSDMVNVISPRVAIGFKGRRGELTGSYDGAFQLYRELTTLNSYDQQASVSARRLVSRHVTLFTGYQMAAAPTTEIAQLVGIPFVRTGSTNQNLRGGVEAAFSPLTSLSATYDFQLVDFEQSQVVGTALPGGHSHGAQVTVRRALSSRVSLTADYNMQRATVGAVSDAFEVHRGEGGIEYKPSLNTRVFAAAGISRLSVTTVAAARTGPSWHAGATRQFEVGTVDATYSRSFVPSYGFGGTQQNEELTARARVPLSRSLYSQSSLSWRRNEPLTEGGLKLHTVSIRASLGYLLAPWAGVEGFFDSASQTVDRAGGDINRRRIGLQIVTTKPMRIR